MLRIVVEIAGGADDAQGIKERLEMELERYGDVRVVSATRSGDDQIKMEG